MSLAVIHSRALNALDAAEVTVEVHLANGLPSFTLVGLADTEVKEARERVRAAIQNSGLEFPHNKRITVNLAPADLPKESGRFDLPIAIGILTAAGSLDAAKVDRFEFAGELSLGGDLRPVRGALAMALASLRGTARSTRSLVLPSASAREAALVEGLKIYGASHLIEVVASLLPEPAEMTGGGAKGANDTEGACDAASVGASTSGAATASVQAAGASLSLAVPERISTPLTQPDMREVKGQAGAKRAMEIAAAGGHSVLMLGSPGTGKSMLAQRFSGLLPPMTQDDALESAAVLSLSGAFSHERWGQRVFRSPHHTASSVALVGGGSPPRPGEISLAHHGVLFLDEFPEFKRSALEALREPLETGHITISRAARQSEFPARFQLIAAMNPCPCGHLGSSTRACRCGPDLVARYQGRISGPLLDRIDVQVEVPSVSPEALSAAPDGEPSSAIAARVSVARELALRRQGCANAALAGDLLDRHCALDATGTKFMQTAAAKLGWSARGFHRALRVARTIADLADDASIGTAHLAEAIQYRRVLTVQ